MQRVRAPLAQRVREHATDEFARNHIRIRQVTAEHFASLRDSVLPDIGRALEHRDDVVHKLGSGSGRQCHLPPCAIFFWCMQVLYNSLDLLIRDNHVAFIIGPPGHVLECGRHRIR